MNDESKVPVEKLRRVYNPDEFSFGTTADVPPVKGFIGQPNAEGALRMGLEIDDPGYHIFVIADSGISRKSVLMNALQEFAEERKLASGCELSDICCIYNFEKPDEPKILIFRKGDGRKFKDRIEGVSKNLQKDIPLLLTSAECADKKDRLAQKIFKKIEKLHDDFEENVRNAGYLIDRNGIRAFSRYPSREHMTMNKEEYHSLSKEEQDEIQQGIKDLLSHNEKIIRKMDELKGDFRQQADELEQKAAEVLLESIFKPLNDNYAAYPEAIDFFQGLRSYILDNLNIFTKEDEADPYAQDYGHERFLPFAVNLVIDNSKTNRAPVIFESTPTYQNLFGKIAKVPVRGGYATGHMHIKAGSLLAANGGYLVLNARDVLFDPLNFGVWQKLENTIKRGFLKIEDPASYFSLVPVSLNPEQIPVKLKVVLVGEAELYHLLVRYDPEFSAIFKVKVEIDTEMPATPENGMAYAGFIALRYKNFDKSAVAKIMEYGHRLADKQAKLSTEFSKIKELIIESKYWAEKSGSDTVQAEHVKKALEAQRSRANLYESKLQEAIREEMRLVATEGCKIGQINGLSVYDLGDYSFGAPSRITAQTFLGRKGLVSLDRVVKMSGPIHDKAVDILSGYFNAKYGKDEEISFSASICFEQSYYGVEGDSASAAELFCLVSSLSEKPIKQNLAVTGSVNQFGEIQPIGGVNQKIEGFFDTCKERGLKDGQGVIIPHQNVKNLMLREDVVQACWEGKFQIHAIKTVDQGLELVLGESAAEIHKKVVVRLKAMTKKIKQK